MLFNMKQSYLFLAPGFEEIEALATVDILRRGGLDVKTVAITADGSPTVTGAHGVPVVADLLPADADLQNADWLICPGGMPGATNLAACRPLTDALKAQAARGGHIAAICASPAVVLEPLGILDGREATCYPGMAPEKTEAHFTGERVVVADNIITGNGPASTFLFAMAILTAARGEKTAADVAAGMLL